MAHHRYSWWNTSKLGYTVGTKCARCSAGKYTGLASGARGCRGCVSGKYSPGELTACWNCTSYSISPLKSMVPTSGSCICKPGYTARDLIRACNASSTCTLAVSQTVTDVHGAEQGLCPLQHCRESCPCVCALHALNRALTLASTHPVRSC